MSGAGEAVIGAKLLNKGAKVAKKANAASDLGKQAIKHADDVPINVKKVTAEYGTNGGHHVHPQSSFKDNIDYKKDKSLAALKDKMSDEMHDEATKLQRSRYKEMKDKFEEGVHPTKKDFDDAALATLKDGKVSTKDAKQMVKESRENLDAAGLVETNIPWGPKLQFPPQ